MSVSALGQNQTLGTSTAAKGTGLTFDVALAAEIQPPERNLTGVGKADYVSGQIGVNVKNGKPSVIVFFDEAGNKLTQVAFDAKMILQTAERLRIPVSDLSGLADKLDAGGVAYTPYAQFAGTGSDHGIDLRDLASGGLGTAYDWRVDVNVKQKGKYAEQALAEANALAERLGLRASPEVTTGGGLAVGALAPQTDKTGVTRPYVVTNGGWAAWYSTEGEARAAATAAKAGLLRLTQSIGG